MLHAIAVRVQGKDLAALAQQMHQVAPITASGIQHPHSARNIPAKDLIEDINIDLPKLLPKIQRHTLTILPRSKGSWEGQASKTIGILGIPLEGDLMRNGEGTNRWVDGSMG